ncbi:MAG: hypothetical protein AB1452_03120 [Pseudomonadota bacterium]
MSVRLKPLHEVLEPDPWWDAFVMFDGKEFRKRRLEDHHAFIAGIELSDSVPANVRLLFDSARNAYLYSFFAHRLLMVADLHAHVSVEFALREKAAVAGRKVSERWGMSRLFKLAIAQKWIVDAGFTVHRRNEAARKERLKMYAELDPKIEYQPPADSQAYCRILADSFPGLRNMHAHGSEAIYPSVLGTFEIAADLIHQLFPPPTAS